MQKMILNVPTITYDGNNAAFFITLLEATLKALGEDCDKAKLTALSGEGNRFCWTDGAWVFGNELTQSINEAPFETENRVLSAIGWNAKYITVQRSVDGGLGDTGIAQIRQDFVSTIDRGIPILIRYREHPDCDLNVFFGYEDNGAKIIGYHYNNGYEAGVAQPESLGQPISWDNWEDNIAGYILLQNITETASERRTALTAFRFITEHARRTSEIRGRKVGLAAWEAFLHQLEYDNFSELALEDVKNRFFIYCDALGQINARKSALPYYRHLAERFPDWRNQLALAIQALDDCASYGGYLWQHGFTFDEAGFERFRGQEARKLLADAGWEAMRQEAFAVEQIEKIQSMS